MLSESDSNLLGTGLELFMLFPNPDAKKQMQRSLAQNLTLAGGSENVTRRACILWGKGSRTTSGSAPLITLFLRNIPSLSEFRLQHIHLALAYPVYFSQDT